jgi:hypothetical protein
VQLCWRAYDVDVLGVQWRGVRAADYARMPGLVRPGRGAIGTVVGRPPRRSAHLGGPARAVWAISVGQPSLWRTIAIAALPSTTCSGTALQCVQVNTAATVSVCRGSVITSLVEQFVGVAR